MSEPAPLPARSETLVRGFAWVARRQLRRRFHAVRLSLGSAAPPAGAAPWLVVMNHPSWWDALVPVPLAERWPARAHFAAIDAAAVEKYRFFLKVGYIPVDQQSFRGAADFLRAGGAVLSHPNAALWVTAQGEFADVRQRPLGLRPGVGHLAVRMAGGFVLPVAVEYPFWNESTPEALIRVGEPLQVAPARDLRAKAWTAEIEAALTETMDALALDARSRDPARFTTILSGGSGVGGVYDWWRRAKAWASGRRFDPSHGGSA